MKRIVLRPGKSGLVSDKALERAPVLKAFGITPEALAKLSAFMGDTTIGPKRTRDWVIKDKSNVATSVRGSQADAIRSGFSQEDRSTTEAKKRN